MILLVPDSLVRRSITAEECVRAVDAGFRLYASGKAAAERNRVSSADEGSPPAVPVGEANARFSYGAHAQVSLYGAYVPGWGLGAKTLGAFESNPERGEPYIHALISVHDPETGKLEAILDGGYLTALRTAAAVAIGFEHLARHDSRVLGILGTGLQARTHLLCHLAVHPFEEVVVWGRTETKVREYIDEMSEQAPIAITACSSPRDLCQKADVVAGTTRARIPLFSACDVRSGTHVGVAGPLRQEGSEIPLSLLESSLLYVDSWTKFEGLWDYGYAPRIEGELGDVMLGRTPGRRSSDDITVFKPVGMAFEDVVSARVVLERVKREGSGISVEW